MKIIANTSNSDSRTTTWLVEATGAELNQIIGKTLYDETRFRIGDVIAVHAIHDHLRHIDACAAELAAAQAVLLDLANKLTPIIPLVKVPTEIKEAKNVMNGADPESDVPF